jgi:hypothetical protein
VAVTGPRPLLQARTALKRWARTSLTPLDRWRLLAFDTAYRLANGRRTPAQDFHRYRWHANVLVVVRLLLQGVGLGVIWPYVLDPWRVRCWARRRWWALATRWHG